MHRAVEDIFSLNNINQCLVQNHAGITSCVDMT